MARTLELEAIEVDVMVTRPARLGSPLGSVIRGQVGERLRDMRCITRATTCEGCGEVLRCDFARVFETPSEVAPGAHGSHAPHPFWLQGVPVADELEPGRRLTARMVVTGLGRPVVPYLDVALRDALGRVGKGDEGRGACLSVGAGRVRPLAWPAERAHPPRVTLVATTPWVLTGDNERGAGDCPAAPFLPGLVRAGLRRVAALVTAYGRGPLDESAALPDLRGVRLVDGALEPWHGSRWSARQRRRTPLEGVWGAVTVEGEGIAALGPLFDALTLFGVGKATAMGFGEVMVM